jgi:thioredoxin reductase (NADPH)
MFTIDELATIPLFSALEEKALEYLAGEVEDIHLTPGEYVAHEGEGRALAIVVEGKTELTKLVNGVEQVIGVRLPGELGGEIPMTLGTPLPASMRAVEPSRVLKVTVEVFHTLAAMAPQVSTAVGAAALERIEMLKNATAQPLEPSMFVIGPRLDPGVHSCASFLHRNQIPYERLDPDDPRAIARTGGEATVAAPYPVVLLRDGTQLIAPTMRVVATVSGLTVAPGRARYDVVIVGGGPAGRHLDPDRELHGVPVRRLRGRAREPGAATGEAAWRSNRRDPPRRSHRPRRHDRHAGWRRRSPDEVDRSRDGRGVATPRD